MHLRTAMAETYKCLGVRFSGGMLAILHYRALCYSKKKCRQNKIVGGGRQQHNEYNGVIGLGKRYLRKLWKRGLDLRKGVPRGFGVGV